MTSARKKLLIVVLAALAAFWVPTAMAHAQTPSWCSSNVGFSGLGAAQSKLVTGVSGQRVYVCGLIASAGAAAGTISLIEGTGTNCATNTLAVLGNSTGSILLPIASQPMVVVSPSPLYKTQVAGNDLCIISASAGPTQGALVFGIAP